MMMRTQCRQIRNMFGQYRIHPESSISDDSEIETYQLPIQDDTGNQEHLTLNDAADGQPPSSLKTTTKQIVFDFYSFLQPGVPQWNRKTNNLKFVVGKRLRERGSTFGN